MKQFSLIAALVAATAGVVPAIPIASAESSDPLPPAKQQMARRLYEEGIEAAGKGRWPIAYDRFKASYAVVPRVLTLFNLASAQAQLGQPVEAAEGFRKFLRETGDGKYPDLRADALVKLERAGKQIAQATLDVANLAAGDLVMIDDIEFPQAVLHEAIPLDPGAHVAVIQRGDATLATRTITLAPGINEPVHIELPIAMDRPRAVPGESSARPVDLTVHPPAAPAAVTGASFDKHPQPESRHGLLRSPWLWSAAAVVVAGSVTAAYLLTRPDGDVLVVR